MKCLNPITLKNGLVVPCGKCELCLSHRRDDWSIRLQIHAKSYDRMPLFLTLTYAPENLIYGEDRPTLYPRDVRLFLKRYKDRYNLCNTDFTYFGCGEYGLAENSSVGIARPHYHLLFFGDDELYNLYDKSVFEAEKHVRDVWQLGIVHVCVAKWSGVHYVTKYCLKENPEDYDKTCERPFTIASNGIGLHWLKSKECKALKNQLERLTVWRSEYEKLFLSLDLDLSNISDSIRKLKRFFSGLTDYPDFKVLLDNGRYVYLPRELRRRVLGSFEHFKDSPLWLFEYYTRLLESLQYYEQNMDYDQSHRIPISLQKNLQRVDEIRKRLVINKYNKLNRK